LAKYLDLVLLDVTTGEVYTVTEGVQDMEDPDNLLTHVTIGGDVMDMVHVLTYSEAVD